MHCSGATVQEILQELEICQRLGFGVIIRGKINFVASDEITALARFRCLQRAAKFHSRDT